MEFLLSLLVPGVIAPVLLRLLVLPVRWIVKLVIHSAGGILCLWLLNLVSGYTGLTLPVNAVTVLLAGVLGLPGIGIVAILELI